MSAVLVLIEHDGGSLLETTREALTLAHRLAESLDAQLEAIVIGDPAELDDAVRGYGFAAAHHLAHEHLSEYAPEAWGEAVAQFAREVEPAAILAAASERGNEVMAHLAARLDEALAANCTEVTVDDAAFTVTRTRWGGSLLEEAQLEGAIKLLTVAPHVVPATERASDTPVDLRSFTPALTAEHARTRVVDRSSRAEGVNLATAPVVVSGGRGVGSAEGFRPLEELAVLLGGAVGCSRAVTNQGWRLHSDQVGQTGTRIAPALYIACGISGATQHWVGCSGSKRILAINTDPDAPLVAKADYAIVGDLAAVVPAIVEEVKRRKRL